MNKTEFLLELTEKLSPLPWEEIEDRWDYYSEMIDDRMDEGLTEEEAVAEMGSVEAIAAQIVSDIPLSRLVKEKIKPKKRFAAWEIVLLVLGSPIWLSLLIAVFAVILSLYVVLWSMMLSLWAVFAALAASALGCIAAGILLAATGSSPAGFVTIGAGILCAGLSIFLFFGCKAATGGIFRLTKKIPLGIKRCFIGKEKAS